jgi:predicted nucleic acid-binding protein
VILVDTSIWIDHLVAADPILAEMLADEQVLIHPFVIGEIAIGQVKDRERFIETLAKLPRAIMARLDEVLRLIDTRRLFGRGIGYIDAHLLASVRLTPDAQLWTRDRRLHAVAVELGVAAPMRRH